MRSNRGYISLLLAPVVTGAAGQDSAVGTRPSTKSAQREYTDSCNGSDLAGFKPLFNGRDLTGWIGATEDYVVRDGILSCKDDAYGTLYSAEEYGDFVLRFEFKLPPGGNNGLAIRAPTKGNPAYEGMEIQILDDTAEPPTTHHWQLHGSIYGVVAPHLGHLRPVGEWNFQEVHAQRTRIKVILNGAPILDVDLSKLSAPADGENHPGLRRTAGHLGFMAHGSAVEFRNIYIKTNDQLPRIDLPPADKLRRDLAAYVESLRVKQTGGPYGVYRAAQNRDPDLYASCQAALVRYVIRDLDLTEEQRVQWIAHINSHQDPTTGKFPHERFLHLFGTVIRALNVLGGQPKYPPTFLSEWDDVQYMKRWMMDLSWSAPWESSIQIMHVASPRAAAPGTTPPADDPQRTWLNAVLDWLDARQDARSGFWGPDWGASQIDSLGATFHFLPLYEAAGRTMPHLPELVRSATAIQRSKYGTWGGVYVDMDAVSLLVYASLHQPALRDEIARSVRQSIDLLFRTAYRRETGVFGNDLGETLGACEHLAEAGRILKDHPYADLGWRRAWDWRLWQCRWHKQEGYLENNK